MKFLCSELRNVTTNYNRTASNRCCECKKSRATVGCSISKCPSQFHFPCAKSHAKFFYCSMAYILERGLYGLIRPTRFIVCDNHVEWKTEWKELSDHLDMLSSTGIEYFNVDKFPLHLQNLVSHASEISLYRPDTLKLVNQAKRQYSIQSVSGPKDIFPSHKLKTLPPNAGRLLIQHSDDYIMNENDCANIYYTSDKPSQSEIERNSKRIRERRLSEKIEIIEDQPKNKNQKLNDPSELIKENSIINVNENLTSISPSTSSSSTARTNNNIKLPGQAPISSSSSSIEIFNITPIDSEIADIKSLKSIDSYCLPANIFQSTSKSFCNTYTGLKVPFTCWDINFEGFPDVIDNKMNQVINNNEIHYCGICTSIVKEVDSLKCLTCPLILHKSCLEYTNLNVQISEIDPNEWSCPICSLCLYCKQSKNRLKTQNLTRDFFKCIFCSEKSPLIFMERLRSGLFAHSVCRFIVNIEDSLSSVCTICNEAGSLIKCGSSDCNVFYHPTCGWKSGYAFSKSIKNSNTNLSLISFCPSHGPKGSDRCNIKKISDIEESKPEEKIEDQKSSEKSENNPGKILKSQIEEKQCQTTENDMKEKLSHHDDGNKIDLSNSDHIIPQSNQNNNNLINQKNTTINHKLLSKNDAQLNDKDNDQNKESQNKIEKDKIKPSKKIPDKLYRFIFEIGNFRHDINDTELYPIYHTSLSDELLSLKSFTWSRLLTKERFVKSQIDFPIGLTNRTLTCVVGVISNSMSLDYFTEDNAIGCLHNSWEFIMLLDKKHFIYKVLQDIYAEDIKKSQYIQILFARSKYFVIGFKKGWRITKKTPIIPKNREIPNLGQKNNEITRGNYIVTDFGKAKLLRSISNPYNQVSNIKSPTTTRNDPPLTSTTSTISSSSSSTTPNTTTNTSSTTTESKKRLLEKDDNEIEKKSQTISNYFAGRRYSPPRILNFNKNIKPIFNRSQENSTTISNDNNFNITGQNKLSGIKPSNFGKISQFNSSLLNTNKNLDKMTSESNQLSSSSPSSSSSNLTAINLKQHQQSLEQDLNNFKSLETISPENSIAQKDNQNNSLNNSGEEDKKKNQTNNNSTQMNSLHQSISNSTINTSSTQQILPSSSSSPSSSLSSPTINTPNISPTYDNINIILPQTEGYSQLTSIKIDIP